MLRFVSCRQCPAAYLVHGATRHDQLVLCRVESTDRGQQSASAGPVSLVRAAQSPSSFHGFCLGRLQQFVAEVDDLGLFATPIERVIAEAAGHHLADTDYTECPSWREETRNRMTSKLVDQPGARRVLEAPRG